MSEYLSTADGQLDYSHCPAAAARNMIMPVEWVYACMYVGMHVCVRMYVRMYVRSYVCNIM